MDEWLGRIKRSFFHAYRIVMHGRIHQVAGPDKFILYFRTDLYGINYTIHLYMTPLRNMFRRTKNLYYYERIFLIRYKMSKQWLKTLIE